MASPEVARFGELLRRLFSTKGYAEANVLEDYFPSIDFFSDKPELLKLRDERAFVVGGVGLGGAGLNGRVWCMNKLPGTLAIIYHIDLGTAVAGQAQTGYVIDMTTIGLPADGAGGQSVGMSQDSRYGTGVPGTTPGSPVTVANDNTGAPSGVPRTSGSIDTRFVLRPGYALTVTARTAGVGNDAMVTFWGYHRAVEDTELK